jgi:VWFA-related protein
LYLFTAVFIAVMPFVCSARQEVTRPSPPPLPTEKEEQEPIKVYTEEVKLPVIAYDSRGRFDPTLESNDVLVLEDGTPQQVRSVRRVPANILIISDMGGQITDTRSMNTTREMALKIVAGLREGDRVAIIQNSNRVEMLSDWTTDTAGVLQILKTKLFSGNHSRLSKCLTAAADKLKEMPVGNTHVVIFTDGLETQNDQGEYAEALGRIVSTQSTTHVITYSGLARQSVKSRNGNLLDMDFEMKRWRKKYAEGMKRNDERLALLVQEMGGRLLMPMTTDEAAAGADEVAHDIGAQYVVTYTPMRPFADSKERRSISISSRRVGLQLIAMRSYVAPSVRP